MRPSLSQISSRCLKCLTCLRSTQRQPKRARSTRTHFTPATTEPIPPTLQRWIDEITSRPPTTHHDSLDTLRTAQLLRSLPTRQHLDCIALNDGDSLPQGAHMIYFQPETMLKDLGSDGSSPEYNAPPPFTRRMWAGGSMSWPPLSSRLSSSSSTSSSSLSSSSSHVGGALKLGSKVIERRSIDKVEYKKGMVFIHQKREIRDTEDRMGVREIRTHVFRPPSSSSPSSPVSSPIPSSSIPSPNPSPSPPPTPKPIATSEKEKENDKSPDIAFTYLPTSPLLFRYSALTFNAHKIHYDHPHSTLPSRNGGEGQEGLLVHGPLTATLLIELAAREGWVREFKYRAISPMVVDQEVRLVGSWILGAGGASREDRAPKGAKTRVMEMMALQADKVCMKATACIET